MLLRKIKYHNFRPFYGDQEVDLTPVDNNDANVIVILGDNTFGKSTFVLSFIWCLYGESRFNRPNDILNKKVEAKMSFSQQETASVEIEFEEDGKLYNVKRTQLFTMGQNNKLNTTKSEVKMTYVENNEVKKVGQFQHEINETISAILPKDLASFFFFEGEKNNEITRKDLGKSVRTLLGLEAFDKMRSHLFGPSTQSSPYVNSVMGYYLSEQNKLSSGKAQDEYNKMCAAEQAVDEINLRISELRENISAYNNQIEAINEALRNAAPSKELQKRRDEIQKKKADSESSLAYSRKKLLKIFSTDSLPLFLKPLVGRTISKLDAMDLADKGIKGIEAVAIHELLNRGVCLCGTSLCEGSLAHKSVKQYIDFIPPKAVGTLVRDMKESLEEIDDKANRFVNDFEDMYKSIQKSKVDIDKYEREDKEALLEIKKIGNVDTTDAENNLRDYKSKLEKLRYELEKKIAEKTTKNNEKETAERNFNLFKSTDEKALEYQKYYKYAEAVYEWVNINYQDKDEKMRQKLSSYVKALFDKMYSHPGERKISIDDKYNISLTQLDDTGLADTGGLRVIQYFAFVGALVKLAYEIKGKNNASEDINSLGEEYPLVLDAAFSHADATHTKNIARELSNATTQLIFALMHKDWEHAKVGLAGRIGRMYELQKIDGVEARFVEVR